jgi:hypothetical protein
VGLLEEGGCVSDFKPNLICQFKCYKYVSPKLFGMGNTGALKGPTSKCVSTDEEWKGGGEKKQRFRISCQEAKRKSRKTVKSRKRAPRILQDS